MGKRHKFINDFHFKEYRKRYKRDWRKSQTKYIAKSPENGKELDVVDMIERNEERFKYGLGLNR